VVEVEQPVLEKPQLSLFNLVDGELTEKEIQEANRLGQSLLEIKELLSDELYVITSKEQLEELRKKIMIKLSESL
ncbi:hypothetical protein, partial [Cetobacterium sp.]|uniref:hypothetical protein n=1 Tax=Cetobacterium sp. TaxID=2071632 RepID=UPI003F36420A